MRTFIGFLLLLSGIFTVSPAAAKVVIDIDLSAQTMHVQGSSGSYDWPISSARGGYVTPNGTFAPQSLQTMHYSKKYYHSPMPHSIFFAGGYAIHGTYETGWLGHPASHGCVRISPENAAILFDMVKEEGAIIHITGQPPATHYAVRQHRRASGYAAAQRGWGRQTYGYSPWGYAPQGPAWGANPYGGY
ncbi:MAG: L,D-transpeptidase [Methylovirgula sp.]